VNWTAYISVLSSLFIMSYMWPVYTNVLYRLYLRHICADELYVAYARILAAQQPGQRAVAQYAGPPAARPEPIAEDGGLLREGGHPRRAALGSSLDVIGHEVAIWGHAHWPASQAGCVLCAIERELPEGLPAAAIGLPPTSPLRTGTVPPAIPREDEFFHDGTG